MRYPVAIEKDPDSDYGVTVVDIPGCFSGGDTLDSAIENAREAIEGHLEVMAETGEIAPTAGTVEEHNQKSELKGVTWAYVDVDVSAFSGKTEKVNVTIPSILAHYIEEAIARGAAKNRSAFLTEAAFRALNFKQPNTQKRAISKKAVKLDALATINSINTTAIEK